MAEEELRLSLTDIEQDLERHVRSKQAELDKAKEKRDYFIGMLKVRVRQEQEAQ